MDVSGLLLREQRVESLLPQLQPSSRLGVSCGQRWRLFAETGSACYILGISLTGVRQVAGRWQVGRCYWRGPTAEEAGAQRPDAVPQLDQGSPQNGQETADAKNDAPEKAWDVEMLQAKPFSRGRLRWDRLSRLICFLLLAYVATAVGSWTGGVAPRGREEWYTNVDFEAKASVGRHLEVLSQVSPATPRDPTSVLPKLLSPRSGLRLRLRVSDKQECGTAVRRISNAAARPLLEGEL